MYKRLLLLALILIAMPFRVSAGEGKNISLLKLRNAFESFDRPVLVKYAAAENNCRVKIDIEEAEVSIETNNGAALKTYRNVLFIDKEPVIGAELLERDMGWAACGHIPVTDMFGSEANAALAGGLTYFNEQGASYYVGRCYEGYYFSEKPGEHTKKCAHGANSDMFYEVRIDLTDDETPQINENAETADEVAADAAIEENEAADEPERVELDKSLRPVLLKYIIEKNGYRFLYEQADNKAVAQNTKGQPVISFKGAAIYNDCLILDAATLERLPEIEKLTHEPDTDIFGREIEAVIAGWLKYYLRSEGSSYTFYVGNCYGGYYFSEKAGSHAANCGHPVNRGMFYEKELRIEDGSLDYNGTVMDVRSEAFTRMVRESMGVYVELPAQAMTKMVTIIHTEYARPEGVQAAYFSYRDRVYRNYWEDVAGYDVTDYIFIPPAFPEQGSLEAFNNEAAKDMGAAIGKLLNYSDAKIWIGTPGINGQNYKNSRITEEALKDFLFKARVYIDNSVWANNVEGLYINQEAIYPENQPMQIDRIKNTVSYFKKENPSKKALWIPYYDMDGASVSIAEKIAEVSRIPNLFDYIIIQPGYFFFEQSNGGLDPETTNHRRQNIDAVKHSAKNNFVSSADGRPVNGKNSNAYIGIEMEPQASYFSNNRETREESLDRYTLYLLAGAKVKDIGPIAFYVSGDPHVNKEALVYKFYEAQELRAGAVRKKLDENLNAFFSYVFETRETDKIFMEYAKNLFMAKGNKTDEDFLSAYNAAVILPWFYEYEKANKVSDLAAEIQAGGSMPVYFDKKLLELLGAD